jgi:prepilin-type N-terminal cleavage/methylation domain-containing protein
MARKSGRKQPPVTSKRQGGFTLLETMVTLAILVVVGAIVMKGTVGMIKTHGTVMNRTALHTSVRSVTELLQQEIGQAGRVATPTEGGNECKMTLGTAVVTATPDNPVNLPVVISSTNCANPVAGLFNNEWIVVDAGLDAGGVPQQESVRITCGNPCTNPVMGNGFMIPHAAGAPVSVQGSFSAGIVPPGMVCNGAPCGSSETVLKLLGDVNGDGSMVYVEYTCQPGTSSAPGLLYRNEMPWNAAAKPAPAPSMLLLTNLLSNPVDQNGNVFPCFQYQTKTVGFCPGCVTYVTDVEVTLTEQTQFEDPQTQEYQRETKALLNVSPRNVFSAWELDGDNLTNRVQPWAMCGDTSCPQLPPSILTLAP